MGIVNVTPDSFYDGDALKTPASAVRHCLRLLDQGARILDLGGASSRPGAREVAPEEEQARLLPVLRGLRARPPEQGTGREAVVSVDTCRASTARLALEAGADIVNDISACADPELLDVLAEYKPGYVLMHSDPAGMREGPRYAHVVDEALHFFETELARLCAAGLAEQSIVLDPGIGFGKRLEDTVALLRDIARLRSLGRPLLAGLSMKSLFGDLLGLAPDRRGPATQVATALLAGKGVALHRVHDVAGALDALRLAHCLGDAALES
jgi:dihydropteroate synthase